MPIRHVAWLKFKEGIAAERIEQHMQACRGLADSVPPVELLECGENISDRAGGFTHGIIVSVANQDGLDEYINHPTHVPVAEALVADLEELTVMDIGF
ncbi:MAG: Dabb family protein [Gemmatimonadota bacterium]